MRANRALDSVRALLQEGHFERAKAEIDAILPKLAGSRAALALLYRAEALEERFQTAAAIAACEAALATPKAGRAVRLAAAASLAALRWSQGEATAGISAARQVEAALPESLSERQRGFDALLYAGAAAQIAEVGRRPGAEQIALIERALGWLEAADRPTEVEAAGLRFRLGMARVADRDLPGARRELERALAIREARFGPRHPSAAYLRHHLAILQIPVDPTAAEAELRAVLADLEALAEAALGPDFPSLIPTLQVLAALEMKRAPDAAQALLERAEAIEIAGFGPDCPSLANTWRLMGSARVAADDLPGAEVHLRRAIAVAEPRLQTQPGLILRPLPGWGGICRTLGRPEESLSFLAPRAKRWEAADAPPELMVVAWRLLAEAHLDLGDAKRAERLLRRALPRAEKLYDPGAPELEPLIEAMVAALEARGRAREARRWRRRLGS